MGEEPAGVCFPDRRSVEVTLESERGHRPDLGGGVEPACDLNTCESDWHYQL